MLRSTESQFSSGIRNWSTVCCVEARPVLAKLGFRVLCFVLICAAFSGCGVTPERVAEEPTSGFFDEGIIGLDYDTPIGLFNGIEGSVIFAQGWSPQKKIGKDPGLYARWAMDGTSVFLFPGSSTSVDLFVRCRAFTWDGAPQQQMTVMLNDIPIWQGTLEPTFQEISIPFPESAIKLGLNVVRLDFEYAERPLDVGINQDARRLSAWFTALAVVPRGLEQPVHWLEGLGIENTQDEGVQAQLPPGAAISIPVPASSQMTLRLGEVSGCSDCLIVVDLLSRDLDLTEIGQVPAASAAGFRTTFTTPAGPPSRLRLSVLDDTGPDRDPAQTVSVILPKNCLSIDEPEDAFVERAKPNIFIYLVDTLRFDSLGDSIGGVAKSPNVDEFSRDAVHYARTSAPSTWTLPSVVSTLTGVYPATHGIMRGDVKFSSENVPGIGYILSQQGYHSVGISQSFISSSRFGVDVGFDDFYLSNFLNSWTLGTHRIRRTLIEWFLHEYRATDAIFAFIHTVGPHAPYSFEQLTTRKFAPQFPGKLPATEYSPQTFLIEGHRDDPQEVAHLRARYQDEVAYADQQFGKFTDLLKALDLYDRSVVVLTSDHGEEFAEHRGFDHGRTVFEELVHVPLYVKYPDSRWAGTQVMERVSGVDLVPTLIEVAGIDRSGYSFDGKSLVSISEEQTAQRSGFVYSEVNPVAGKHRAEVDYKTAVVGDIKCIFSGNRVNQFHEPIPEWRFFDLASDPQELHPLTEVSDLAEQCMETIRRVSLTQVDSSSEGKEGIEDIDREKLRALGYIK